MVLDHLTRLCIPFITLTTLLTTPWSIINSPWSIINNPWYIINNLRFTTNSSSTLSIMSMLFTKPLFTTTFTTILPPLP